MSSPYNPTEDAPKNLQAGTVGGPTSELLDRIERNTTVREFPGLVKPPVLNTPDAVNWREAPVTLTIVDAGGKFGVALNGSRVFVGVQAQAIDALARLGAALGLDIEEIVDHAQKHEVFK